MKLTSYALMLALFLFSANAFAECTKGGRTYQEGEKVGPYTCEGGRWVRN